MKSKKQFTNRILSLVLALMMVVGLLPMTAFAATSGTCGDGVSFTINNGTLTITGSGAVMKEAGYKCWENERNSITKVVIGNGVTLSNSYVLQYHNNLTAVEYGGTVTTIEGVSVFFGDSELSSFTLHEGVGKSNNAFGSCNKLQGEGVTLVDSNGNKKTSFYSVSVETNTASKNYMTVKGNLSKGSIKDIPDQKYTGGEVKPDVTVMWNGQTVDSSNYTVTYSDNTQPGMATVTVTGKEDQYYTGTITKNFTILEPNYVTGIALQETESKIYVGSSKEIFASVSPDDATIKDLDWSIADNSIASITPSADGVSCTVTGLKSGTTTLTAAAKDGSGVSVTCAVKVSYLSTPDISYFNVSGHDYYDEPGKVYWFKLGAEAEVFSPEDCLSSKTLDGDYNHSLSFSEDDNKTIYLKRYSDGAMTDAVDLSAYLKWDDTPPVGKIHLSTGEFWTELINKISFGMFFKERKTVTITAQDSESGVKSIQYYYYMEDLINDSSLSAAEAAAKLEADIGSQWKDYNGSIELWQDGEYIVYAKLTDNVGNVSYLSSNGFVLYSDATSTTTSLTTTYKAGEDKDISVVLNGNTVNEVKCGNVVLAETDYIVGSDKITLKSEYLDTLAAGDYTITVSLNPQGESYVEAANNERPAELTASLIVNPKNVTVPMVDTNNLVYDGSEQTYSIVSSDWYTVTGNKQSGAGTYIVTVSLKDKNNTVWADGTANDKTYTFHIAKATYDMSGAKWSYSEAFKYDDKEKTVEVIGLPFGVTVSSYTGNSAAVVGNYTAKVTLSYDSNNYNAPYVDDLNWKIENNWTPTEYTVNGSGWMNRDFVIAAKAGYKVSLANTAGGTWEDTLTYSAETSDGSVTFYLKDERSGAISLAETVGYKIDKTAPTGKIGFVERTGWEEFVNTITFGQFYKDEVTVKITGTDNLSDEVKIEYYESDEALTLAEVETITDWTEYNGEFGVTLKEAKKFVYFVRITDKAGNMTILSTDGAEYDATAPDIEGVENDKTYYTTQKVTITEKNVDTITLNGNPATESITLDGNKEAIYTIVATDKAGNITSVTVTMKPIKELAKATENLTHDNVSSADAPALKALIEKLDELIADSDTSDDGERETLQQHKVIAESLLKTIEETFAEINKPVTNTGSPQTGDNSNILLWVVLMCVSGGAVIIRTVADRKKLNSLTK